MTENAAGVRARDFLAASYPDGRELAHAEKWLGIIAVAVQDGERFGWWHLAALVRRSAIVVTRVLVLGTLVVAVGVLGGIAAAGNGPVDLALYLTALAVSGLGFGLVFAQRHNRKRTPRPVLVEPVVIVPRWPRWRGVLLLVLAAIPLGVLVPPALVALWTVPAAERPLASPVTTFRSDRLALLCRGLAWAPLGVLPAVVTGAPGSVTWVLVVIAYAAVATVVAGARSGAAAMLACAELVLAAEWGERASLRALLTSAAGRGVLRTVGSRYEFADGAMHAYLAERGRAALAAHRSQVASRLSADVVGGRLVGFLRARIVRMSVDGAVAWAIVGSLVVGAIARSNGSQFPADLIAVVPGAGLGLWGGAITFFGVYLALSLVRLGFGYVPAWPRRVRLLIVMGMVAAGAALVTTAGTALAAVVSFLLPPTLVAGCGVWVCVLVSRRVRGVRLLRWLPDVLAVATDTAILLELVRRSLLSATPAAGLLFPVAAWGTVRAWRAMRSSRRLLVRSGANIAVSLLAGGELVLFLVWLANVVSFPVPVVAALRWWLVEVGSRVDLPWWMWTGIYAFLAGAGLAFLRWPSRLKRAARWLDRLRLAPVADVGQQVLTSVHIGLLAIVLVGLAAPPTVGPALRDRLTAVYLVALQRSFTAAGEIEAYTQITSQFPVSTSQPVLTALVQDVHDVAGPSGGAGSATNTEEDLARRLGLAQVLTLALPVAPSAADAERAAASRFTGSGEASLNAEAGALEEQEKSDDAQSKRVEETADLAAKLVASTISIPSVSDNEVFQVVREYLSGLVEGSGLAAVFAAWLERLPGTQPPPDAATVVTPDPSSLEAAATTMLSDAMTAQGLDNPVTDPSANDPAWVRAQGEDPLTAAVDIVNQARYAQEQSGSCAGCTRPEPPAEEHPVEIPEEHFVG